MATRASTSKKRTPAGAQHLGGAAHKGKTEATVIRELHAAGESRATIRARTGASPQAIHAALKRSGRRGRPVSRTKAEALREAALELQIALDAGSDGDAHLITLGALRRALGHAYDQGASAAGAASAVSRRRKAAPP